MKNIIEIVVTRHPALVEYLREIGIASPATRLLSHASPDDVRGKHVAGVLPHSLSCLAESFTEIPLNHLPPELRGTELPIEQLRKYAGDPVTYRVTSAAAFAAESAVIAGGTSTNGRWGISVVGPVGLSLGKPQEGTMTSIGVVDGHDTFAFTPEPGCGTWYLVGQHLAPKAGCEVVCSRGLQSSRDCTVIAGGEFFAVVDRGSMGRGSTTRCYIRGGQVDVPPAVLVSMGLLPTKQEPEPVKVQAPPLSSAMSDALAKAGVL